MFKKQLLKSPPFGLQTRSGELKDKTKMKKNLTKANLFYQSFLFLVSNL